MDGPKSFPGKQTADLGLLSPFRVDGWMLEIIGFKLLTKGQEFLMVGATRLKALLAIFLAKGWKSWIGF